MQAFLVQPRALRSNHPICHTEAKEFQPNLKQVLKDCVAWRLKPREKDRKKSVEVVKNTIEKYFVDHMKEEDSLFNELYQNLYYTGSYYEGRDVSANVAQFDLNIQLKLPFGKDEHEVVHQDIPPGYVQYRLNNSLEKLLSQKPKWDIYKNLAELMDDTQLLLSQEKLIQWMQSIVEKTLDKYGDQFPNVTRSYCGPTILLTIKSPKDGSIVNVALVPVIQLETFPGSVRKTPLLDNISDNRKTCFIEPKPLPAHLCPMENADKFFRVSMPDVERLMMGNKGCIKMLIKIFKAIRDSQKWLFLRSYYIKTIFLWVLEKFDEADFWSEDIVDSRFILMLHEFISVMDKRTLHHIFFPGYNLLAVAASAETFNNARDHFETILKWSLRDLHKLKQYLMRQKSGPPMGLKGVLKEFVATRVTLPEDDRKRSVDLVQDVVEKQFVECMKKEDPLFNELYQNIYYTGSYYEGLKVNTANEFDLNLRLKLPFNHHNIQIVHLGVPHGYVQYQLDRPLENLLSQQPKWNIFKNLEKIMDETRTYLSQDGLNRWLQSVVDKALNNNKVHFPNVTRSCKGPAKTLKIESPDSGPILDVDLVPVVQLPTYPGSVRRTPFLKGIPDKKKTCFIVPKPPPTHLRQMPNSDKFFRVSIPNAEKLLMDGKGCVKMLIKIFKAIRDRENWQFLCSYYIKTVFFRGLENTKSDFWSEKKLDWLFLLMLRRFISVMDKKALPHIFFQKYNLLAAAPPDIQTNAKGRLETFLKWSEKDLPKLKAYLMISQPTT